MSGPLSHSPADIVRWLLIQEGFGTDPDSGGAWPVYASDEPSLPDNCLTVFDTQGFDDGRRMTDGRRDEHHGFQVRVRSTGHPAGYAKARAVAVGLDTGVYRESVTIGGSSYCVHSVTRTSDVIPLGKESPTSKRRLFTVNAVVHLYQSD